MARRKIRAKGVVLDVAIDPGVTLGWAAWRVPSPGKQMPWRSGVVLPPEKGAWEDRVDFSLERLNRCIDGRKVRQVWCERPQYFASFGGHTAASSGSLAKLCLAAGRCWELAVRTWGARFHWIEIQEWKGDLSKEQVQYRIEHMFEGDPKLARMSNQTHDWDAIGIGLYARGQF